MTHPRLFLHYLLMIKTGSKHRHADFSFLRTGLVTANITNTNTHTHKLRVLRNLVSIQPFPAWIFSKTTKNSPLLSSNRSFMFKTEINPLSKHFELINIKAAALSHSQTRRLRNLNPTKQTFHVDCPVSAIEASVFTMWATDNQRLFVDGRLTPLPGVGHTL